MTTDRALMRYHSKLALLSSLLVVKVQVFTCSRGNQTSSLSDAIWEYTPHLTLTYPLTLSLPLSLSLSPSLSLPHSLSLSLSLSLPLSVSLRKCTLFCVRLDMQEDLPSSLHAVYSNLLDSLHQLPGSFGAAPAGLPSDVARGCRIPEGLEAAWVAPRETPQRGVDTRLGRLFCGAWQSATWTLSMGPWELLVSVSF